MRRTELIDARFAELLERGQEILATRRAPPLNVVGDDRIDFAMSREWSTSAAQLLSGLFGRDSEYYQNFHKAFKYAGYFSDMVGAFAVLRAAYNDYSKGYLTELRTLVAAEIFDDLLEQAQHLFEQGYYQGAAVLAGGVLEDALRKMCQGAGIALHTKPKLDTMNAELAKKGSYNTLVQKRVTALADLRNKAAHGNWSEFSKTDVDDMLRQVRNFITDYSSQP